MDHAINETNKGTFTAKEREMIAKVVGSFLSRLPDSTINGPQDVQVSVGTPQPGVLGEAPAPEAVMVTLDFPPIAVRHNEKQRFMSAMEGAFLARHQLDRRDTMPHAGGNLENALTLTFPNITDAREFFNGLSRIRPFKHPDIGAALG